MPDYQKGKIYSIRSHLTEDVYIGSTCNRLSDRMAQHRYDAKNNIGSCKSKTIFDFEDAYIELIEDYPCENREQLNRREGEIIRATICVNKGIAGRTKKEYNEDNKEAIAEQKKQYREDNKETITEQKKQYREQIKEETKEYNKQYRLANKEKIAEQRKLAYQNKKEQSPA